MDCGKESVIQCHSFVWNLLIKLESNGVQLGEEYLEMFFLQHAILLQKHLQMFSLQKYGTKVGT